MLPPQRSHAYFTPEEYLELERQSPIKHEYLQGQVVAMAGASKAHVLIVGNLSALLLGALRGSGCVPFASDIKVRLEASNAFFYPDLAVSCDDRDLQADDDALRFPVLIVEVLSKTTESFDRGEKFASYRAIGSLREYVLVHQDALIVEVFVRESEGLWVPSVYRAGDRLALGSVGVSCAVEDLYLGVEQLR